MKLSFDDKLMKDPEEDLNGDPKKGPELEEHQLDHDVEDVKSRVLYSSFDSSEEPMDESDPDYDPYRDC